MRRGGSSDPGPHIVAYVFVLVLVAGCREGPSGPTSDPGAFPAVFGSWSGISQVAGTTSTSNWSATLVQVSSEISGTFSCTGAGGSSTLNNSSTITQSGQLRLAYAFALCGVTLTAQVSGNNLSGTFTANGACGCFGTNAVGSSATGTWSGTRQ